MYRRVVSTALLGGGTLNILYDRQTIVPLLLRYDMTVRVLVSIGQQYVHTPLLSYRGTAVLRLYLHRLLHRSLHTLPGHRPRLLRHPRCSEMLKSTRSGFHKGVSSTMRLLSSSRAKVGFYFEISECNLHRRQILKALKIGYQ